MCVCVYFTAPLGVVSAVGKYAEKERVKGRGNQRTQKRLVVQVAMLRAKPSPLRVSDTGGYCFWLLVTGRLLGLYLGTSSGLSVCVRACVCVHVCVRACMRACVHA